MSIAPELMKKSKEELTKLLGDLRVDLRESRFKATVRDLKNVRHIRATRKKIAHILTILNEKK